MENWSRAQRIFLDMRGVSLLKFVISALIFLVLLGSSPRVVWGDEVEDLFGSITVVREPVPAVIIDEGLIPVGEIHTYSYRLEKDHTYHIYLSGEWADPEEHATDYDLFVYEYDAYSFTLLSTHTKAAGLLEQVGNDLLGRFFTPDASGLYYIAVRNDVLESSASEPGTLMVIEKIETDTLHERWMEGKIDEEPQSTTFWSYEFTTSSPRIQIQVDVPDTLDMYEARLYVMANPEAGIGEWINGIPVAWEPGLRGELNGIYGGFNLDQTGFRHVDAMASSERNGEDMIIEYTAPAEGEILYHIAFIAEYGIGKIEFIVQTDFDPPNITIYDPPVIVDALKTIPLEFEVSDQSEITSLDFSYSTDGWENWQTLYPFTTENGTQQVIISPVNPGTNVEYLIESKDSMGIEGETHGSFYAMGTSILAISLSEEEITSGEEVEIKGRLNPSEENVNITLQKGETIIKVTQATDPDGRFNYSFKPISIGTWMIWANFSGNEAFHPTEAGLLNFTVSSLQTSITFTMDTERIESGKTVTVTGSLDIGIPDVMVEILVINEEETKKIYTKTDSLGRFTSSFKPLAKGQHTVKTRVIGDGFLYSDSESIPEVLSVVKPSVVTALSRVPFLKPPFLYGIVGVVGVTVGGVVFYLRRRE
jgi:hypothetical protein